MILNGTNYVIAPHHTIYFSCLHKESAILSSPFSNMRALCDQKQQQFTGSSALLTFMFSCARKKQKNMWRHHGRDFLRQLLLVCGHAKLAFLQMCCKQGFKKNLKKKKPGQPTKHFRRFRCSLQFCRALTSLKKKKSTPNKQHSILHLTPLHTVLLLYIHIHMCVFTYQWQVAHPW